MSPVDVEQRTDDRSTMQGVGGQPIPFGPPVGRLSVQGVGELLRMDPTNPFDRGGLMALAQRVNDPSAEKDQKLVQA
nr:hypothetical protein [Acidimicrobiia bacterium]